MTAAPGPGRDPLESDAAVPLSIGVREGADGEGWIVDVAGEIDVATSPRLGETLGELTESGASVTVDLSETSFIDSSGLGVLVAAYNDVRGRGRGELRLRGLQEPVRRVFEITGLTELFAVEG